jgi:hypothetical protein
MWLFICTAFILLSNKTIQLISATATIKLTKTIGSFCSKTNFLRRLIVLGLPFQSVIPGLARGHLKARIQWRGLLPPLLALASVGSTTKLEMILFVLLCPRDSRQVDYLISLSKYCHCLLSFPLKKLRQCKYGLKAHLSYHIL